MADPPEARPARLSVYAVNGPLAYFADRLGGELVEVGFPVPPGVDPAHWSPDAETVAELQAADLVLLNGAGYSGWVSRVSLPAAGLVDTSAGLATRLIPLRESVTHTHGPGGEHSHVAWAATTWLDPDLARSQAAAVRDALARALPAEDAAIGGRFERLSADLAALDDAQSAALAKHRARPLLFSRPVYQYLIRRYELEARSLDWTVDAMPEEADWRELESLVGETDAATMIWDTEPSREIAERLAAMGLSVVVYDPGGNPPAGTDWLSLMRANVAALARSAPGRG